MDRQPLISIIVPVYKVEKYLDKCVSSIVNQTYQNLEIILVDDGSPDSCGAMCDAWAAKDSRIRVIHKENGGLSDARNAGLAVANGEYVSFVDSDDWVSWGFIENLWNAIEQTGSDISTCLIIPVYEGEHVDPRHCPGEIECIQAEEALSRLIEDKLRQVVWNKLYKREVIADILFAKGKLHEDEFWSYQIIGNARRIAITDAPGYYYLQRGESIMGSKYTLRRLDAIEAKEQRQIYLERHFPNLASLGRRNLVFTCLYHGQKVQSSLMGEEKKQATIRLKGVIQSNPLCREDKAALPFTHRLWCALARLSLGLTCRLRNLLKVGL